MHCIPQEFVYLRLLMSFDFLKDPKLHNITFSNFSVVAHRMLYNNLPYPVWRAELAPEFTLMMPVSMRSVSAYQANIPNIHDPAVGAGGGAAVGTNVVNVAPAAASTVRTAHNAAGQSNIGSSGGNRTSIGGSSVSSGSGSGSGSSNSPAPSIASSASTTGVEMSPLHSIKCPVWQPQQQQATLG